MYEGNDEGGEDSEGPGEKGVGLTVLVGTPVGDEVGNGAGETEGCGVGGEVGSGKG